MFCASVVSSLVRRRWTASASDDESVKLRRFYHMLDIPRTAFLSFSAFKNLRTPGKLGNLPFFLQNAKTYLCSALLVRQSEERGDILCSNLSHCQKYEQVYITLRTIYWLASILLLSKSYFEV